MKRVKGWSQFWFVVSMAGVAASMNAATLRSDNDTPQISAQQQAKLSPNDLESLDTFGTSVAISGDTAIIGSPSDDIGTNDHQGSAYVFVRTGSTWTQQAKLTASDGATSDFFGSSVSISGNIAIIGAPGDDIGSNLGQGSAYIFTRSGTTWSQTIKLTASDGEEFDIFGSSVAISGLTVVIGAPLDDIGPTSGQGSAYVFIRSVTIPNIWFSQGKLIFEDGGVFDRLGSSVGISGDTIVVGARLDDLGTNVDQGSAFVFTRTGTTWTQQDRLVANDGSADDEFGASISISGDSVIIGSPFDDGKGSAYIFIRSGATWSQERKLVAPDGEGADDFGTDVSISGDTAMVGSPLDDTDPNDDRGSAYLFVRSATTWRFLRKIFGFDGTKGDQFGTSVAVSGRLAVGGAPLALGAADSGAAYTFVAATPFDFDGDGKSDIGIFRPSSGEWWIRQSSTGNVTALQFGSGPDKIVPADFTGDGKTDIAVWRPSTGFWFVLRSENASFFGFPWGANGDIPAPFDADGDTLAEPVVFRPSIGTWFVSQIGPSNIDQTFPFGINGDVPLPGGFDLDGANTLAVYRPSNGQWWLRRTGGTLAVTFGSGADKPVPGDYTGDDVADIALWRPSTGEWFILRSENFSFFSFPFGTNGDVPAPGDYDGDGRFDATVFRPSNGTWFSQRSTAGLLVQQFGASGDRPIASAFVP